MTIDERLDALTADPDIIWGCRAIGQILNLTPKMAFHHLNQGAIPAARKVGGRWCASRRELLRMFVTDAAVKQQEAE